MSFFDPSGESQAGMKSRSAAHGTASGTPLPPNPDLVDREAGVRFALDGRVLTVRLLASAPRKTRLRVPGKRIRATCGRAFTEGPGPGPLAYPRQTRTRLWPAGRTRVRFRFHGDISRVARWCRHEDPVVGHVAFVKFRGAVTSQPPPTVRPAGMRPSRSANGSPANAWARGREGTARRRRRGFGSRSEAPRSGTSLSRATERPPSSRRARWSSSSSPGTRFAAFWLISKLGRNAGRGFSSSRRRLVRRAVWGRRDRARKRGCIGG
jgi:hypothetical protein